jgi:trimethylamine-N-oxide reductase (cytochrome c)
MTIQAANSQRTQGISRRSLLISTAATGVMSLVAGPMLFARASRAAVPDGEVLTASHWGVFKAKVEGGRFVGLTAWEKDPRPSAQLPGVQDSVYSPTRIRYPMVRRAYLKNGPGASPETRGADDFVRVSWDQALDLVAKELKRVRDKDGPTALFAGSYGWKSPGQLHNCQTLLRRAMNLTGGFVNISGDYSTGASQVIMPHVVGSIEVYEQQTVWPVVLQNTELLVLWG